MSSHKVEYGIHEVDDVLYLFQGGKNVQNVLGLKTQPSFTALDNIFSPHKIDLNQQTDVNIINIREDKLVQVLAPVPKTEQGSFFIEETPDTKALLFYMHQISSPAMMNIGPSTYFNLGRISKLLRSSNIMTYIITNIGIDHLDYIKEVTNLCYYSTSKVLFVGSPRIPLPPGVNKISTDLKYHPGMNATYWKQVGVTLLKGYMTDGTVG